MIGPLWGALGPLGQKYGGGIPAITWPLFGDDLSVSGYTLTRIATSGNLPRGGAVSSQTLTGDGAVSFVASDATKEANIGFGPGEVPPGTYGPRFNVVANDNGMWYTVDGGTLHGPHGSYSNGDTFTVRRVGSTVTAERNGTAGYTFSFGILTPLRAQAHVETAGYSVVTSFEGAWATTPFVNDWPTWSLQADIKQTAHVLYRDSGGAAWDTGNEAVSAEKLPAGVAGSLSDVAMTGAQGFQPRLMGLHSSGSFVGSIGTWPYMLDFGGNGSLLVIESGGVPHSEAPGFIQVGDTVSIDVAAGGIVSYSRNGTTFYTSATSRSADLYAHAEIFAPGDNPASTFAPYLSGAWV